MWRSLLKKRSESINGEAEYNHISESLCEPITSSYSSGNYRAQNRLHDLRGNVSFADETNKPMDSQVAVIKSTHCDTNSGSDCNSLSRSPSPIGESVGNPNSRGGHSMLSQTLIRGLQNPPSMSFVASMRSAYSSAAMDHRTGEDLRADNRWVLPSLLESSDPNKWSAYNNAHRTVSVWLAGWNVINLIQGAGILAIPYACLHAGWLCIPLVCVIAMITCYTGHLVGECLYDKPRYSLAGYRDLSRNRVRSTLACTAADAIPWGASQFTTCIVLVDMFGAAVLYLLLLGRSIAMLLEPLVNVEWPVSYWTLFGGCLQIPLILCPTLHIIAWFSMLSMISLHSCIVIGIVYCIQQAKQNSLMGMYLPPPNLDHLPIAISIIVFSYTTHAALPGIEGSMKRPGYFPKMLNLAFIVASVIKLSFGLLCAIVIGPALRDSVSDSLQNWPQLAIAMNTCVAVSVFFSCPLFFHILGEQIDTVIAPHVRRGFLSNRTCVSIYTIWFVGTRGALLILALLVAYLLPHFATIIGFLGAITCCFLAFVLPCLLHLILFYRHLSCCSKLVRILIAMLGLVVGVFGVIASSAHP